MDFRHKPELALLGDALQTLGDGFSDLPDHAPHYGLDRVADVLQEAARRMQDNYPYHHPGYAGQMLKPPHPVARLAYALSLWLNPNNHALDGGRASSAMEMESVAAIASMFGMPVFLGHLCGGGTMANLEALWVASCQSPGRVLASDQAHYTHRRLSQVLKFEFASVPVTATGSMDLVPLRSLLEEGNVGTVIVTLGTTGLGAIDPLADILELRDEFGFRVHVDAAYGGYFCLASELSHEAQRHYGCIAQADSIVLDPHKHGLQPYGCGCVLFSDPEVGTLYQHQSAYTYFTSTEMHLGEISLECSRPGAAAVALWATQKLLPMERGGEFSAGLDRSLLAAGRLHRHIEDSPAFMALLQPALDIVVFAVRAADAVTASDRARHLFDGAAQRNMHLALVDLPATLVRAMWPDLQLNRDTVTCLRSCLMKPEHLDQVDDIAATLDVLASEISP